MADVKISGLPASTTPLAGTEVLPIVQGGQTKQVSVANLTAGRPISATSLNITGVTFANLPLANTVSGQIYSVTDVGINGSLWQSNGTTWGLVNGKASLYDSSIPFILPSSGTMGNNGALTVTTALQTTYTNAYVYLPANAIVAGSAAGWYYAVFSSTTLATVYNNTYTSGTPTIPASPTAFSTTGPGAYTQTTAQITGITVPVIGNTFGLTGGLNCCFSNALNNSASNKSILPYYGSSGFHQGNNITTQYQLIEIAYIKNRNLTNKQIGYCITSVPGAFAGLLQQTTVDSTATQNFALRIQLSNATDYIVVESCILTLER